MCQVWMWSEWSGRTWTTHCNSTPAMQTSSVRSPEATTLTGRSWRAIVSAFFHTHCQVLNGCLVICSFSFVSDDKEYIGTAFCTWRNVFIYTSSVLSNPCWWSCPNVSFYECCQTLRIRSLMPSACRWLQCLRNLLNIFECLFCICKILMEYCNYSSRCRCNSGYLAT